MWYAKEQKNLEQNSYLLQGYNISMLKGLGLFTHLQMSYLLAEFSRGSERNGHSVLKCTVCLPGKVYVLWLKVLQKTKQSRIGSRINK